MEAHEEAEKAESLAAAKEILGRTGETEEVDEDEESQPRRKYVRDVRFHNPDAKFVMLYELALKHIIYAERHLGEVCYFPAEIEEKLEKLGMFQPKYGFQYVRKPFSLVRPNLGLVARRTVAENVEHLDTSFRRVIVAGKPGTGKSFLLMQIAAAALMQNYIVIAVPRGPTLLAGFFWVGADFLQGWIWWIIGRRMHPTRKECGINRWSMWLQCCLARDKRVDNNFPK